MKIGAEQTIYHRTIIEAFLDAGELEAAQKLATKWIEVLGEEPADHSSELSELHSILGTIYFCKNESTLSKQ
jgi:hypothetical protein